MYTTLYVYAYMIGLALCESSLCEIFTSYQFAKLSPYKVSHHVHVWDWLEKTENPKRV